MAEMAAQSSEPIGGGQDDAPGGAGLLQRVVSSTAAACEAQTVARVRQQEDMYLSLIHI